MQQIGTTQSCTLRNLGQESIRVVGFCASQKNLKGLLTLKFCQICLKFSYKFVKKSFGKIFKLFHRALRGGVVRSKSKLQTIFSCSSQVESCRAVVPGGTYSGAPEYRAGGNLLQAATVCCVFAAARTGTGSIWFGIISSRFAR